MEVSPANFELEYITSFFRIHLDEFEHMEEAGSDATRITQKVQLAASMRQSLLDLRSKDGGSYYRISSHLNSALNAEARLSRFLVGALAHYEIPAVNALVPRRIDPYPVDLGKGFRVFELDEYIDYLECCVTDVGLEASLPTPQTRAEYSYTESELLSYLQFIVGSSGAPSAKDAARRVACVCLLRDTLLLYLGLRYLRRAGWDVDVHAVLANRALIQSFTPG
jgi:hypothetical protein